MDHGFAARLPPVLQLRHVSQLHDRRLRPARRLFRLVPWRRRVAGGLNCRG
jgi:hypothetical protein